MREEEETLVPLSTREKELFAEQCFITAVSGMYGSASSKDNKPVVSSSNSISTGSGSLISLPSTENELESLEFVDCSSDSEGMPIPNGSRPVAEDIPYGSKSPPKPKVSDEIDAINALHIKMAACGQKLDIPLPQIVVVGPESSGKSSVLQALVGKDFLPKGAGLQTRRPTLIHLIPIKEGEAYGVFAHLSKEGEVEKRFYDFDDIRQEIEDETDRSLQPKCFSSVPINLTIYSTRVLKLTLVDLPGLVKVKLDDQQDSSVSTVREMVLEYIRNPSTIILAICNANQPLSTADALQIAHEVDPERKRTIGVLTKIDIMSPGTNALDVLENRQLRLERGYVGVINRSQLDIDNNVDMAIVAEREMKFFNNPDNNYSHIAYRMGTAYLQKLLHKTLRQHIKSELPEVRENINLRYAALERELRRFEEEIGTTATGNRYYLMGYVHHFVQNVTVEVLGYDDSIDTENVAAGAYINFMLNIEIQKFLEMDLQPDEKELGISIANLCGIRNSISVPSLSMDALCRKLVGKFNEPLEKTLHKVKQILLDAVIDRTKVMDKYPSLKNEVIYRVNCSIKNLAEKTQERLASHIESEKFFVNLNHPDYDSGECDSIAPTAGCVQSWKGNDSAKIEPSNGAPRTANDADPSKENLVNMLMQNEVLQKRVQYVSMMLMRYLKIVKKNVADLAIKYISFFLVKKFLDFLGGKLETDIFNSPNLEILMQDSEEDIRHKQELEATCKYLKEALALIEHF